MLRTSHLVLRVAAALAWAMAMPPLCDAWGPVGHRAVGRIADQRLSPDAGRAVAALLGRETLAEASLWADGIRSQGKWRVTAPWHYVNIPDGKQYDPSRRSREGDVVLALDRFVAVLGSDAPKADRVAALRFIAHFVGDIHQPLHVGRASDRGGNRVDVNWFGEPSNLHRVWDSGLIARLRLTPKGLVRKLDSIPVAEVSAWADDGPRVWIEQSMALRPLIYDTHGRRLGRAYVRTAGPVVEQRLLQGGVRLAALLNAIFD